MPRLRALLFDLDGTLCDSDPVHAGAWEEVLARRGVAMPIERYRAVISGKLNAEIGAMLFPDRPVSEHEAMADEKEALFRERAGGLARLAGLDALLERARREGLATALVTNAPRLNVEHMLAGLGLAGAFAVEVLAEDLGRGKPDPLPYATALARLGITAGEGLAFEDSSSGIRSAKGAGLTVVGVATGHGEADLLAAGADIAVSHFADPRLAPFLGDPKPGR
jgi:HAD superfamily hydrolase (TIGR01509 family)